MKPTENNKKIHTVKFLNRYGSSVHKRKDIKSAGEVTWTKNYV